MKNFLVLLLLFCFSVTYGKTIKEKEDSKTEFSEKNITAPLIFEFMFIERNELVFILRTNDEISININNKVCFQNIDMPVYQLAWTYG